MTPKTESGRALDECLTCHGAEWIDDGCGVVMCPDCSVTESVYREAASKAVAEVRAGLRDTVLTWFEDDDVNGNAETLIDRLLALIASESKP